MTPVLWSLSYSPWSDKARWALDHCEVEYRRKAYQPLIGEPALRVKLRRPTGTVSVPILETDEGVLSDSWDIARWADRQAAADRRLFPEGTEGRIERYNALSESALAAGRRLGLQRVVSDDAALLELVPSGMRKVMGPLALRTSRWGVRRTMRKYAEVTPSDLRRTLTEFVTTLRADLAKATPDADGVRHLLGRFSYADIVMAEALAFIEPPHTHLRLGDASRRCYQWEDRPADCDDLVAWRDALFARRKPDRKR